MTETFSFPLIIGWIFDFLPIIVFSAILYFIFTHLKTQFTILLPGESIRYEEEDVALEMRNASGISPYNGVSVRITNMRILIGFGKISKGSVRLYQSLRYVDEVQMGGYAKSPKNFFSRFTNIRIEKKDISFVGNDVHIQASFRDALHSSEVIITVKNISLFKSAIV